MAPLKDIVGALKLCGLISVLDDVEIDGLSPDDTGDIWEALAGYGFFQQKLFDAFFFFHALCPEAQAYVINELSQDYDLDSVEKLLDIMDPAARQKRLYEGLSSGAPQKPQRTHKL